MTLWSDNPGKRRAQTVYLIFTPIWAVACASVMFSAGSERWTDAPLLALGMGLYGLLLAAGFVFRTEDERARPFYAIYHFKLSAFIATLAFCGNYFGTRYFYEVLDMHYGFHAHWTLNDVPVFLYPLTAVYFTTYSVLLDMALRAGSSVLKGSLGSRGGTLVALVLTSIALAGLETSLNANPAMKSKFCYGNLRFALWFGSLMYGTHFMLAGPCWHRIHERRGQDTPLREVLATVLAASMLILVVDEVIAHAIAPRFTTVVAGRVGIPGRPGPSCLAP